jgi:hypothetical protein
VLLLLAAAPAEGEVIRQWDRFEIAVTNATRYADPYREVSLDAELTRPDGSVVTSRGFYDGGQTWRLRFMPDQVGEWAFESTFSDGREGVTGTFTCETSDLPGPVTAYGPNPIWFGMASGEPFLMRSLHAGDRFFARNWDDSRDPHDGNRRAVFLDWAQQQGYNTLSIASFLLNRDAEGRGRGWDTPKLWPLDAAEFRRAEEILDELAARRIVVFPFAGLLGRDADIPRDAAEQELYLRYVLARFGPYWNLLQNLSGPEPLLRGKRVLTFSEIGRIARSFQAIESFAHPLTVHNATGDDAFRGEAWFGFGTLQGPKTVDRRRLAEVLLRNHHPARPLYAQETLWPGNTVGHPSYSSEDIRRNAFVMLFSAAMINFGDMQGNSSSGFSSSMDPTEAITERHETIRDVWDTFAGLPWPRTRPRPDLVNTGFCLADPGRTYLVYLDEPSPLSVKVEDGPFDIDWFPARGGAQAAAHGQTADGRDLTPPGPGEWIVLLTSQSARRIREETGRVSFEAEDGVGNWRLIPAPGGRAIQDPGAGRMQYEIEFTTPGRYYVFLYARQGPSGPGKDNDAALSLNGERLYGSDDRTRPEGMRVHGGWKWSHLPKGPGAHTPDGIRNDPVYFRVPAPGRYTFEIAHRSARFAVDAVVMQREDPAVPE